MAIPSTVERAIEDVPVADARCLEAGAGVGNMTAALREAGADSVVSITNDHDHAVDVRDRFDRKLDVVEGDLRSTPLTDDSVSVVTAHALFNVIAPAAVPAIVEELTRVADAGAWLVVDDYDPVQHEELRALFATENAAAELADGQPALTFYPAAHLRNCFEAAGWRLVEEQTLLNPVPWTADLLDAHADLARESAATLDDGLAAELQADVTRRRTRLGTSVDAGRMYSLAFRLET